MCLLGSLIPFSLVLLSSTERLRAGVLASIAAQSGVNGAGNLMPDDADIGALLNALAVLVVAAVVVVIYRRDGARARGPGGLDR